LRHDIADQILGLLPATAYWGHTLLSATQTGNIRRYAAAVAFGALLLLVALLLTTRVLWLTC
jgi:hypothetical protein